MGNPPPPRLSTPWSSEDVPHREKEEDEGASVPGVQAKMKVRARLLGGVQGAVYPQVGVPALHCILCGFTGASGGLLLGVRSIKLERSEASSKSAKHPERWFPNATLHGFWDGGRSELSFCIALTSGWVEEVRKTY